MTPSPLNPWLDEALTKARRLCEDSDRVTLAFRLFQATVHDVHRLATNAAIRCTAPKVDRYQPEEGSPTLLLEWHDQTSGWFLAFAVKRGPSVRPFVTLELSGQPKQYYIERPSDHDITQALHDYFEAWKREP